MKNNGVELRDIDFVAKLVQLPHSNILRKFLSISNDLKVLDPD